MINDTLFSQQLSNSGLSGIRRAGSVTSCLSQTSVAQGSINNLQQASRVFGEIRQAFQNTFLKRTNANTQAAIWRRKTAKQLLSGNASPFLALVGVTLASGPGIVTKQDELEFVCKEIQKSARKTLISLEDINEESGVPNVDKDRASSSDEEQSSSGYSWSLKDFEFSSVIAKGCNAVVKAAKFKDTVLASFAGLAYNGIDDATEEDVKRETLVKQKVSQSTINTEESFVKPREELSSVKNERQMMSSEKAIRATKVDRYPLAIKQMFNYDIESNAQIIFRAMYREIVVARESSLPDEIAEWSRGLHSRKKTLPPHPNIIEMPLAFTDYIPNSSEAMDLYPDALPQRLNPNGAGRNMSLFLVMKRYDCTLREFLESFKDSDGKLTLSWKTSLILLTQLMEGITHMVNHEIAHRDLKSDNILVNRAFSNTIVGEKEARSQNYQFPNLVITDFGCCLADSKLGLKLPYTSYETDRGGNIALMAPEVINAEPGIFSSIDYSKADVWSAGAIAYELFGAPNPFYMENNMNKRANRKSAFSRYVADKSQCNLHITI